MVSASSLFRAVLIFLLTVACNASEDDVVSRECKGRLEVTLPDKTRVDCLTDDVAYEYDYAEKWAECVTQAMHYGMWTDRRGACVLIYKKPEDFRYFNRAQNLIWHYKIDIDLMRINE